MSLINDFHVHFGQTSLVYHSLGIHDIEKHRETHRIERVVAMSFEQDIEENNKKLIELAKQYPWLCPLYFINGSSKPDEVEKYLKEKQVAGIKFHGSFVNKPVCHDDFKQFFDMLDDLAGTVLVHTGRYKDGDPESNTSYLHALELAKSYPNIKVVYAHMGGTDTNIIKRAVNDSKSYSNIYLDTSGITTPYAIEYALKNGIDKGRLVFGSDAPFCSMQSMYWNIQGADISEDAKHMIFYENFNRLLGLL